MHQKCLFTDSRGATNYLLTPFDNTHSFSMQALTAVKCVPVIRLGQVAISPVGAANLALL